MHKPLSPRIGQTIERHYLDLLTAVKYPSVTAWGSLTPESQTAERRLSRYQGYVRYTYGLTVPQILSALNNWRNATMQEV